MRPLRIVPPAAAALFAVLVAGGAEKPEIPSFPGAIRGYTVPARDFLLKGDSAQPRPNGRIWLEGVTVETRRSSNQINFVVTTPSGEFIRDENRVTSTNTLDVRSRDDRFQLGGTGFDYEPLTNRLTIHSRVVTRFDRGFFERRLPAASAPPGTTNSPPLQITSESFRFEGTSGDAVYSRDVRFSDGMGLRAEAGELALNLREMTNESRRVIARGDVRLQLRQNEAGGTAEAQAGEAVFSSAPGTDARVELRGSPSWNYQLVSGRADLVTWSMSSNRYEVVGAGGAGLHLPFSAIGSHQAVVRPPADTNLVWMDLTSDRHRAVPGELLFEGKVVGRQDTNWMLSTRRLVVRLDATNHPTQLEADGDFVFESYQPDRTGRGTAGHALVENPKDGPPIVTLTEHPGWAMEELTLTADQIVAVDPLGEPDISGEGNVRLQFRGLQVTDVNWLGMGTNATPKPLKDGDSRDEVIITARQSRWQAGRAEFTGDVMVTSGTNFLAAPALSMEFTPDRQLTNLVASGGVRARQGAILLSADRVTTSFAGGKPGVPRMAALGNVRVCGGLADGAGRGTGSSLHYDGGTGEAVLAGTPELLLFKTKVKPGSREPLPVLHKAPEIRWNLRDETFRLTSPFSIVTLPENVDVPRSCD